MPSTSLLERLKSDKSYLSILQRMTEHMLVHIPTSLSHPLENAKRRELALQATKLSLSCMNRRLETKIESLGEEIQSLQQENFYVLDPIRPIRKIAERTRRAIEIASD